MGERFSRGKMGWTRKWMLILVIFLPAALAQVYINEIMYDPGDGNEWIELYNGGNLSINLQSWTLTDNQNKDELVCCNFDQNCSLIIPPNNYALITDQDTSLYNTSFYNYTLTTAIRICVDDNSIGNGLGNDGDNINLSNGTVSLFLSYDHTMGAASNNKSLEKDNEGNWLKSKFAGGTPGKENSVANISSDLSFLAISEILANPFENDNALKSEGEWIEILNYGPQEVYAGGLRITDLNDEHELLVADSAVLNGEDLFVPPGGYLVVYRDGDPDFALNNDGYEEVRLFSPDNELIDFMSYTGTTEGSSWSGIDDEWYETSPTPGEDNEYTGDCIWFLYIDMNNSLFKPEDFSFTITVSRIAGLIDNVTVRGAIEDANGNSAAQYAPWTNETVVSDRSQKYSPNLNDGFYQASFWFENPPCLDVDPNDYRVTRAFAISSTYQQADSTLAINNVNLGSDNKVPWGGQFTVELAVYKGNTTATTLAAWVEKEGKQVSKKTTLNAERPYQFYPLTLPLQLIPNCNQELADGIAAVIIEGLGKRTEESITIAGVDNDVCKKYTSQIKKELKKLEQQQKKQNKEKGNGTAAKDQQFFLEELPASISPGGVLRVQAHIFNQDKIKHDYRLWSYLFRGNKCYSCQDSALAREANLQKFTLAQQETKDIEFLLKLDEQAKEGEYKVKVKMLKDEQKTEKELTSLIYVLLEEKEEQKEKLKEAESSLSALSKKDEQQPAFLLQKRKVSDGLTGFVVYESSSERSKKVVPYVLVAALVSLVIIVLKKM